MMASKPAQELATHYDIEDSAPVPLLYAVHTYYALFIKALCAHLTAPEEGGDGCDEDATYMRCEQLEDPSFWTSRGIGNFLEGDVFGWYLDAWSNELDAAIGTLFDTLDGHTSGACAVGIQTSRDLLKALYQSLLPAAVRHDLGEYYTPDWLADLTLREIDFDGSMHQRVLDPACGSGTFLVAALNRVKQRHAEIDGGSASNRTALVESMATNIVGFDLNPLAVLAARANYLLTLRELLGDAPTIDIPVHRRDTIMDEPTSLQRFDFVVGNPPWVNWQHLCEERRDEIKPLWQLYGLFSLSGTRGRLGGGKKDLSMLFTYVCADRYLKPEGTLAFLITQSVFKSKGAGDGFRRFRYQSEDQTVYLKPTVVHDFSAFEPFEGATTQTALCCLRKTDQPVDYPVDYRQWTKTGRGRISSDAGLDRALERLNVADRAARPVDADHDASPWLTAPTGALAGISKVIGHSAYTAYEGVNSGGLNGCYWVREIQRRIDGYTVIENLANVGRIKVDPIRQEVESTRIFPLLRSGDLERWCAEPSTSIILAQDPRTRAGIPESTMAAEFPKTYRYFKRFEGSKSDPRRGTLRGRSLFRRYYKPDDPFYSMYGVGPYTMSPWKVCWTRIDTRLRAVVVGPTAQGRVVLPQETITFVPTEDPGEAHYFCALFNSSPADALVRCYSTGKGFASAHILDTLGIPAYDGADATHCSLSRLSRQCHAAAGDENRDAIEGIEHQIDRLAGVIWELSEEELAGVQQGLAEA